MTPVQIHNHNILTLERERRRRARIPPLSLTWYHREITATDLPEWIVERLAEDKRRRQYLVAILSDQTLASRDRAECEADCLTFIERWTRAPAPRENPAWGLGDLPLLPYPRQADYVRWLCKSIEGASSQGDEAAVVKCRAAGITLLTLMVICWYWLYRPGFSARLLSRASNLVDDGSRECLFGLLRLQLDSLPHHLMPARARKGSEPRGDQYASDHHRLRLGNGNIILGETTTADVGRSLRATVMFFDEFAAVHPTNQSAAWLALETVARLKLAVSTPSDNTYDKFAELAGPESRLPENKLFVYHWRDIPQYTEDWYEALLIENGGRLSRAEREREYGLSFAGSSGLNVFTLNPAAGYREADLDPLARTHWMALGMMDFGSGPAWTVLSIFLIEWRAEFKLPILWWDLCRAWKSVTAERIAREALEELAQYSGKVIVLSDPAGMARDAEQESWITRLRTHGLPVGPLDGWYNTEDGLSEGIRNGNELLSDGFLRIHRERSAIGWHAVENWRYSAPAGVPPELLKLTILKPEKTIHSHPGDTLRYAAAYARRALSRVKPKPMDGAAMARLISPGGMRLPASLG